MFFVLHIGCKWVQMRTSLRCTTCSHRHLQFAITVAPSERSLSHMLQLDEKSIDFDLPNKKLHNWTDTIKCLFLVCTWISDFVGTILKKFYHFRILTVYWHLVKTIFIAQFCFSFQTELCDIVTSTIYTRLARNFGIWNENNR